MYGQTGAKFDAAAVCINTESVVCVGGGEEGGGGLKLGKVKLGGGEASKLFGAFAASHRPKREEGLGSVHLLG